MTNFHVIENSTLAEFVKEVRNFLRAGWKLHGPTQVTATGVHNQSKIYTQAIVQDEAADQL